MLHTVANTLKANNLKDLRPAPRPVMAENKAMSKELEKLKAQIAAAKIDSLFENAADIERRAIVSAYLTGTGADTLRGMVDKHPRQGPQRRVACLSARRW